MAEPAIRAPGEGELLRTQNRDLRVRACFVDFIRARDRGEDVDPEDFDIFDAE